MIISECSSQYKIYIHHPYNKVNVLLGIDMSADAAFVLMAIRLKF